MEIIVGRQNVLTSDFTVVGTQGTLAIKNNNGWDLGITDIIRIENTTRSNEFKIASTTTFSQAFVAGLPVYTWVFQNLPALTASGDTLLIYLNATLPQANFLVDEYTASLTV